LRRRKKRKGLRKIRSDRHREEGRNRSTNIGSSQLSLGRRPRKMARAYLNSAETHDEGGERKTGRRERKKR